MWLKSLLIIEKKKLSNKHEKNSESFEVMQWPNTFVDFESWTVTASLNFFIKKKFRT